VSARHDEGFFSAQDNLRLFWESDVPTASRAHVAIIHGYAEHSGRYAKVIAYLVEQGFAVHAFDYRGHGQSDGRRGHCDAFSEYVDDVDRFLTRVHAGAGGQKVFILAHSHGALIVLHWLAKASFIPAGLIFSAPWLRLGFEPPKLKVLAGRAMAKIMPWLPFGNELVPEQMTRDVEVQRATERDPLYNRQTTPGWFVAATGAQADALTLGPTIQTPLLVVYGSEDVVALPQTTRTFFETIASGDKTLREYAGMRHEVLREIGKEDVFREISDWISAHL
jgi:alpha-beta hydrolase superfamily lysophospholipase